MNRTRSLHLLLFAVFLLLLPAVAGAQAAPTFHAWVDRLNQPEAVDDALRDYVTENFHPTFLEQVPVPQAVGFLKQLRAAAPFSTVVLEEETAHAVRAQMRADNGSWFQADFELHATERTIVGLLVQPSAGPQSTSISWKSLDDLAAHLRDTFDLPGLAIAVSRRDGEVEQAVAGVREIGTETAVESGDRFHIGSISKSVTATVVAALVEAERLSWDATLDQLLPGAAGSYADVTLRTVLRHQARIPQHLTFDGAEMTRLNGIPGTTAEQRAAYVAEVLALEPLEPGFAYSNAGYALAGHLAERAAGLSWEELVREKVFGPLGLESCGVGWPATAERPDEPRGHYARGEGLAVQGLGEYRLGAFMGPAGNLHCSVLDLTRYGLAHLDGLRGKDGFLEAATVQELHRAPAETGAPYAAGWGIDPKTGLHRHNGSAGTFFSYLAIHPEKELVITLLTNVGPDRGAAAAERLTSEILDAGNSP